MNFTFKYICKYLMCLLFIYPYSCLYIQLSERKQVETARECIRICYWAVFIGHLLKFEKQNPLEQRRWSLSYWNDLNR